MRKIMFITMVILMLASCPIIFLFVDWKLEKPRDLEKEAKILKNGIINSYSKKNIRWILWYKVWIDNKR